MEGYTEQKKKLLNLSNAGLIVLVSLSVLFIVALSTSVYFYRQAHGTTKDPQKDLEQTIKLVGKHIVLPTGEVPTMATVSDPEKLKDQPFFINATKGDKVLIYAQSQKAILYNPTTDRIIEVAPINAQAAAQIQNPTSGNKTN